MNLRKKILLIGLSVIVCTICFANNTVYASETVSDLAELQAAIENAGTTPTTITISGTIEVQGTIAIPESSDITFVGGDLNSGLHGDGTAPVITTGNNSHLTIGESENETLTISGGNTSTRGGGINVEGSSTLTMNGGVIVGNSARYGGGIYIGGNSTLIMNAGTIVDNSARHGGGVYVDENGYFIMNNGDIFENKTLLTGGGIAAQKDALLIINDGEIRKNKAGDNGGGIFINTSNAKVNKVLIEENSARLGGGIYSEIGTTFNLKNAFVSQNTAEDSGGGMWFCPDGTPVFNTTSGVTIVNNKAVDTAGDDFHSDYKNNSSAIVYLTSRMLGGGEYSWYNDSSDQRYKEDDEKIEVGYQDVTANASFKSKASNLDITNARNLSSVIILNNYADAAGGGFASNGSVTFGEKKEDVNLKVIKKWEDNGNTSGKRPNAISVKLMKDGAEFGFPVTLSDGNNWEYEFKDLPAYTESPSGNITHTYTIEEISVSKYEVFYSAVEYDSSTRTYTIVMTNVYKEALVSFSKTAVTGTEELIGAHLSVVEGEGDSGTEIENWVSTEEIKKIYLEKEKVYTMIETKAPNGYEIAENIIFRITKEGKVEIKENNIWKTQQEALVHMKDKPIQKPSIGKVLQKKSEEEIVTIKTSVAPNTGDSSSFRGHFILLLISSSIIFVYKEKKLNKI